MKRVIVLALMTAVACGDTSTTPVTQLNLDRPTDIAFGCYGGLRLTNGAAATEDQQIVASAQPVASCDTRSAVSGQRPPGQEDLSAQSTVGSISYYALILQSGPGTVAIARFDTQETYGVNSVNVLDTDALAPGSNSIAVGEDPIAIGADRNGCYAVIANAGSCDMSVLDITSAAAAAEGGSGEPIVNRMRVMNASGVPIDAKPAAMVFEPQTGPIGQACPATAAGLAYVAYPSCHAVIGVDVSTGVAVNSITFDANGVPTIGDGNITCPSECDGSGTVVPGVRPVTLDLEVDPVSARRLLSIGADNSNLVTLYDLDAANKPTTLTQIPLEDTNGRLGIIATSISPVIGMGGNMGYIDPEGLAPGGNHQFVYSVTNDGTVHVVDLFGVPHECDTQLDPRYLRDLRDIDQLACLPIGDPTYPRRAGVKGPGIELPADAIATSVDFVRVDNPDPNSKPDPRPATLVGYFAIVTATNGVSFVVNVDDDNFPDDVDPTNPLSTPIPDTLPHQLRDAVPTRGLLAERPVAVGGNMSENRFVCDDPGPDPDTVGANSGGPRLLGGIQRTVPPNTLAVEKYGGLPSIRQVLCDSTYPDAQDVPVPDIYFGAPVDVRNDVFPDLRALSSDEIWTLTWEGALSQDSVNANIDGVRVHEGQMFADGLGIRIVDQSKPFCDAGVEPYDILQLRGCDPTIGDAGCPVGYTCYVHPQSKVAGLGSCMLINEADRLSNACKLFLTSLRRYTIGRAQTGEVLLIPRKHVLRTSPTTGCTNDEQCQSLANYAAKGPSSANPIDDMTAPDPKTYACQLDPDRRPELDLNGEPMKRCIATCNDLENSSDCEAGTVCQENGGAAPAAGYCMESVTPPQSCINAPQRYELDAGDAFTVIGSRTGFLHSIIADANGTCVKDPDANPLLVGRLPLRAPACDPAADPLTGRLPDGTYQSNPCETTVDETEYQLNYIPDTCTLGMPDENIVTRPADAIQLRNRALTFTVVDPTYQGDLRCHGDGGGMLQDVPLVSPGFQLAFRQTAGFSPVILSGVQAAFPVKVTRGPRDSIWIVDQGDFLSTSLGQASTRGRVYRVESTDIGTVNTVE
jgi:hypothetical protein